jgi:hypothetical protein
VAPASRAGSSANGPLVPDDEGDPRRQRVPNLSQPDGPGAGRLSSMDDQKAGVLRRSAAQRLSSRQLNFV